MLGQNPVSVRHLARHGVREVRRTNGQGVGPRCRRRTTLYDVCIFGTCYTKKLKELRDSDALLLGGLDRSEDGAGAQPGPLGTPRHHISAFRVGDDV